MGYSREKVILILLSVFLIGGPVSASDKGLTRFQGVVMVIDFKKNTCVVNEKQVQWSSSTVVHNEREGAALIENLKIDNWVYVEGIYNKRSKTIEAKKIYLLSKRIDEKEKGRYPFLK